MLRFVVGSYLLAVAFAGSALVAQQPAATTASDGAKLPLKQVVMFTSGVAFHEHAGQVHDNAHVDLKFNVGDVNDLLKSMVLQDLDGGKVATVTYGSKDPITRTLKTFSIDLTTNPTLADLLGQVRGERVQVDAPNPITGSIVGVEKRKQRVKDEVIEASFLNLLTDEGLRSVNLDQVSRIKLMNDKLDAELRQALHVLATTNSRDKKTVTLNFMGTGTRNVRVGYVQESPLWKTSYRLVLRGKEQPLLQGWAIVENTTENDWENVKLTLVSGRPISFLMDLYQPLYIPRPLAKLDIFASLRPQTYEQDLEPAEKEALAERRREAIGRLAPPPPLGAAPKAALKDGKASEDAGLWQGVTSLAQGGDVGELFQYQIESPVTLPRRQSAMLPIVNGAVAAEKVSIFNPDVHAKNPLNGLRLTNSTSLHLMQGPITVFDDGVYAGDAQIKDLPPGAKRLVSYAMDLDTEVAMLREEKPQELVQCRVVKGVMEISHRLRRTREYTVKNSGKAAKTVLIEQPLQAGWKLTEPAKPEETTRDLYRFAVKAEPAQEVKLLVAEESPRSQQIALTTLESDAIYYYVNQQVVSDSVKEALREVIRRKQELADITGQKRRLQEQISAITQEQDRIRKNMEQLDRTSDLYKRYVGKFTSQEDQIDKLRTQIDDLAAQESARRKALDEYLVKLTLE